MPAPLLAVADYEARAREMMPLVLFRAKFHMETDNIGPFNAIKFQPRVLVNSGKRDLSTEVLGQKISFPVMCAASGSHQLFHPDGELATARAAGGVGTLMALSLSSNFSMEEVAQVATGPLWFQVYLLKDRELTASMVHRAEKAGYKAILFTVDIAGSSGFTRKLRSARWGDITYGYIPEADARMGNFIGIGRPDLEKSPDHYDGIRDRGITWGEVDWIRSLTSLPLIIKGIQTAEDARLCIDHGADGILVSNHGANTVPGARSTIEALPDVVEAAGDKVEVFLDGGVRRGTDVLKALALGARAVLIGRAMFFGLVVDGEKGLRAVLEILRQELDSAMGFCGVASLRNVDRTLVTRPVRANGRDVVSQLEGLARLVEQGYVSKQEFETLKMGLIRGDES